MAAPSVGELMTPDPVTTTSKTSVAHAARLMRDHDVGHVVIVDGDGQPSGVLTDRDIVIRVVADGQSAEETTVSAAASGEVSSVEPSISANDAAQVIRDQAIRRLPVVDRGDVVGVVSIGDLAVHLDPESALADVSASSPNR